MSQQTAMLKKMMQEQSAVTRMDAQDPVFGNLPNSSLLSRAGAQSAGNPALGDMMQSKMRQHFLDNQISSAESEADRIAASVSGAESAEEVKYRLGEEMGADFSNVRFHTDSSSAARAEAMGARAYTTGRDIYFGEGGFDASVAAHELVHTAQQGYVDSGMSTVSAPAGGVQMMPKFLKNLFRSKNQKTVDEASMPAATGQYAPQMIDKTEMEKIRPEIEGGNAMRGMNSAGTMMAPLVNPLHAQRQNMIGQMDAKGFDYTKAASTLKTYHADALGNTNFNAKSLGVSSKMMESMGEQIDSPEYQDMLRNVYQMHDNNWSARLGRLEDTPEERDSYMLKQVMSKGLGSVMKGTSVNGQNVDGDKLKFLFSGVTTNLGNAEGLYRKLDDPDMPQELKDYITTSYVPVRAKMLAAMKGQQQTPPTTTTAPPTVTPPATPTRTVSPGPGKSHTTQADMPQSGPGWEHTGSWKVLGEDSFTHDAIRRDVMPGGSKEFGEKPAATTAPKKKGFLSRLFGK